MTGKGEICMKIKEKIKIGIDKIGFAMPKYFLDIRDLAIGRNENENNGVAKAIRKYALNYSE